MDTIIKYLFSLLLIVGLVGCSNNQSHFEVEEESYRWMEWENEEYKYNSHLVNFLIIGTDTYDNQVGQSDFIGLLIFDRENEEIEFLSLSRNAYVPIKTYDAQGNFLDWSRNYLALSYAYGQDSKSGCYLTSDAVSRLLNDIPITYFASFSLDGISTIHQVVEPLEVIIPDDSLTFYDESLKMGEKLVLTSDNVETFVRMRDTSTNFTNTNRMQRQKTYLTAYVEKLSESLVNDFNGTASKLETVLEGCTTNFDLTEVESFANMLLSYNWDENSFYQLPGEEEKGLNHDKFIVDEDSLTSMIVDLFYAKR